jgi:ubiquinone/menaquinone biosynthesis C-methylase UbiE
VLGPARWPELHGCLVFKEIRGTRVLDVGCGAGVYGYLLRNKWQDTPSGCGQFRDFGTRDTRLDEPELLAGIDIQIENVRRCKKHNIYDFLALADASRLPFPDNYVDTILCVEVLEHLVKSDALRAITEFRRVARQRIIITVPKHALDKHIDSDERDFLKILTEDEDVKEWIRAETHKSSFSIRELRRLGFRVGRSVQPGWMAPAYFLAKLWELYGLRSEQLIAVKDLHKQLKACSLEAPLRPPRVMEGFPDYR